MGSKNARAPYQEAKIECNQSSARHDATQLTTKLHHREPASGCGSGSGRDGRTDGRPKNWKEIMLLLNIRKMRFQWDRMCNVHIRSYLCNPSLAIGLESLSLVFFFLFFFHFVQITPKHIKEVFADVFVALFFLFGFILLYFFFVRFASLSLFERSSRAFPPLIWYGTNMDTSFVVRLTLLDHIEGYHY